MSRNWRLALLKLALLGTSVLVAITLCEIGLRVTGLDFPRVWEPDAEVGWRPIPGAVRRFTDEGDGLVEINSLGLRDRERPGPLDAKTPRIAVFGDSMTEADQVNLPDTYTARLEESLRQSGKGAEVWNFGVTGYSPIQELLLFRKEAAKYRPRIVVLSIFLDNDVSGCHPSLSVAPEAPFAIIDDSGVRFDYSRSEASYNDYHRFPFYTLRKYSALYRTAWTVRSRLQPRSPNAGTPQRFELYEPTPGPKWQAAWTTLETILREFAKDTRALGAELVVVSVPAAQVVNPGAWDQLKRDWPAMQEREWDLEGPERRLRAFADAERLRLIQPYEDFAEVVKTTPLYYGAVGHLNAKGHELLASHIATFLASDAALLLNAPISH